MSTEQKLEDVPMDQPVDINQPSTSGLPQKVKVTRRIKRILLCELCAFRTYHRDLLQRHVKYRHPRGEDIVWYQCPRCVEKFPRVKELNKHVEVHTVEISVKCPGGEDMSFRVSTEKQEVPKEEEETSNDNSDLRSSETEETCSTLLSNIDFPETLTPDSRRLESEESSQLPDVDIQTPKEEQPSASFTGPSTSFIGPSTFTSETILIEQPSTSKDEFQVPKVYECRICPYRTTHINLLKHHRYMRHTTEQLYKCDQCDFHTKKITNLIHHKKRHFRIIDFRCGFCPKNTESGSLSCDQCPFQVAKTGCLPNHFQVTHEPEDEIHSFPCKDCNYIGKEVVRLNIHVTRVHKKPDPDKKCVCHICGQKTPFFYLLIHHLNTHHKKPQRKEHQCEFCVYSTHYPAELVEHYADNHHVSRWNKAHKCSRCPYTTSWPNSLRYHMMKEHPDDVKMFACRSCEFRTEDQVEFRKHVKVEHLKKKIICKKCKYYTMIPFHMTRHMNRAHPESSGETSGEGERPPEEELRLYSCDRCTYKFKVMSKLKAHRKSVHKIE